MAVAKRARSRSKVGMQPHLMIQTNEIGLHHSPASTDSMSRFSGLDDLSNSPFDSDSDVGRPHPSMDMKSSSPTSHPGDKRRNKLGYHRTSMACGHCRKRKIRCLLAPDDPQGRCANCIRLKKDCNFAPVDAQSQPERRHRNGSRTAIERVAASSTGAASATSATPNSSTAGYYSSSSSPSVSPSQPSSAVFEQQHHHHGSFSHFSGASHPSLSAPHHQQAFAPTSGTIHRGSSSTSISQPSMIPIGVDVSHMHEGHASWDGSSMLEPSPTSGGMSETFEDPSTNFWRLSENPARFASFSGPTSSAQGARYSHSHAPPNGHAQPSPYSNPRDGASWSMGPRAMSIAQVEGIPSAANMPAPPSQAPEMTQTPVSDLYSPRSNTRSASMASIAEPPPAPADGQPLQEFLGVHGTAGPTPTWNPAFVNSNTMAGMTGKGFEGMGGWYSDPSPHHLSPFGDEMLGATLCEGQQVFYQ